MNKAIIVDVDGTVALTDTRYPYHLGIELLNDEPNWPVLDAVRAMWLFNRDVIFLSGRMDSGDCRKYTTQWLNQYISYNHSGLFMRADGDYRKDSVVKRELYETHIKPRWEVTHVFDDRDQVVKMWREEVGLPVFQVAYGNF